MMTGFGILTAKNWSVSLAILASFVLAACDENGDFAFPAGESAAPASEQPLPANALGQRLQSDIDVERPDILAISDDGLWDGRPSLGGIWVAHPEVTDPERVVIRNTDGGQEIIGALFRRERDNPGPLLQVSSDAAEALGMLPGAPTRLEVVVLRRQEVEPITTEENPVIESLAAPVSVESAPLAPAEPEGAAVATAAVAAVALPAAEAASSAAEQTVAATAATASTAAAAVVPAAPAAPDETIDVSAILDTPAPLEAGTQAQIGIFSVEQNANRAVATITDAGIAAVVTPQELGGRTVWRVTAGPLADTADITRLRELGFVDAFVIEDTE